MYWSLETEAAHVFKLSTNKTNVDDMRALQVPFFSAWCYGCLTDRAGRHVQLAKVDELDHESCMLRHLSLVYVVCIGLASKPRTKLERLHLHLGKHDWTRRVRLIGLRWRIRKLGSCSAIFAYSVISSNVTSIAFVNILLTSLSSFQMWGTPCSS
jgi:hypothetical protein